MYKTRWIDNDDLDIKLADFASGKTNTPGDCEKCGSALRAYIHIWNGNYRRASCWCWCEKCKTFTHFVSPANKKFHNDPRVDPEKLGLFPDYLSEIIKEF